MCVSVWQWLCPSFVYSLYVNWWLDINVQGTDGTSETSTDRKKRNETKSGCKSTRHLILYEHHVVFNGGLKLSPYQEGVHWGHRCRELISFSCSLFIFYFQSILRCWPLEIMHIHDCSDTEIISCQCLSLCLWFKCLINMSGQDVLLLWVLG